MKRTKRVLPNDTLLSKYFAYKNRHIFAVTTVGIDKYMLRIVHCWDDGEIMNFAYTGEDGNLVYPTETLPNPRHIVKIFNGFPSASTLYKYVKSFVEENYNNKFDMAADCANC